VVVAVVVVVVSVIELLSCMKITEKETVLYIQEGDWNVRMLDRI
jgi:hypothetical protein